MLAMGSSALSSTAWETERELPGLVPFQGHDTQHFPKVFTAGPGDILVLLFSYPNNVEEGWRDSVHSSCREGK